MGYYASGGGCIRLRSMNEEECIRLMNKIAEKTNNAKVEVDDETDIEAVIEDMVSNYLEDYAGFEVQEIYTSSNGEIVIDVYHIDKYHADDTTDALHTLAPFMTDCGIELAGEDDCHWQFVLHDGEIVEQNGTVYYDVVTECHCDDADCMYARDGVCYNGQIHLQKTADGTFICADRNSQSENI